MVSIVWLRQDLRVADHEALTAAARAGAVIPVYVHGPEELTPWGPGGASRWWLHHALASLAGALERLGSRLILRRGPALTTLRALARETGAGQVLWQRGYEPAVRQRDDAVAAALRREGVAVRVASGGLLWEPDQVATGQGRPYQVFTPFYRACLAREDLAEPLPAPARLPPPAAWPESLPLADLRLLPRPNWASRFPEYWQPGLEGADDQLAGLLHERLGAYPTERDLPARRGTSRLSPHLRFGELSPRQVWWACRQSAVLHPEPGWLKGEEAYLRQLVWREFAYHLLHHFPHTPQAPLRPQYAAFPWRSAPEELAAWQQGRTGYPIVDAGMRELWATGWMHNRVRMIAGSFLVKDLLLDWRHGADWFWDTLVDADLANNTLGWQWIGGCGADAAPYFRVFNPVLQAAKFDPHGDYVRRWVPELARLPTAHLHAPWQADARTLRAAGVVLGGNYPHPLVDHHAARDRALEALATLPPREP